MLLWIEAAARGLDKIFPRENHSTTLPNTIMVRSRSKADRAVLSSTEVSDFGTAKIAMY
jgi:hypothetical protein